MNIVKHLIIWIVLLIAGLFTASAQADKAVAVLNEFQKSYTENRDYNLDMIYTLYRGYEGEEVTQQYEGTLYKKGSFFRMTAMQMEAMQFSEGQVRVDHKNKIIYYNQLEGNIENPADITQILQYYTPVSLENKGKTNIIALELKNRQLPLPFQRVILHIDQQTNTLQQQELFFGQKMPFTNASGNQELDLARVIIRLSNRDTNVKEQTKSFSDYITKKASSIDVGAAYKQYTLIDQTNR